MPASPRQSVALFAKSVLAVFVIFLPYLQVLTDANNRHEVGYSGIMFVHILALVVLVALAATAMVLLLNRIAGLLPTAVRGRCVRVLLAPAVGLVLTSVVSLALGAFGLFPSTRELYLPAVAAILIGLLVGSAWSAPRLWPAMERALVLTAPILPIVALTFWSYPDATIELEKLSGRQASSAVPHATKLGGPIVIVMFDAWDYDVAFRDPNAFDRWPNLSELSRTSVLFTDAQSPAMFTLNSIPRFLLQTDEPIYFYPGYKWRLGPAGKERPSWEYANLFQTLGGPETESIVLGSQLDYRSLLGESVDIAFTSRPERHVQGLAQLRRHLRAASSFTYLPLAWLLDFAGAEAKLHAVDVNEVHALALTTLRDGNRDRITFIHYMLPHKPFVFDRHGLKASLEAPAEMPDTEGYFGNLDYLDTLLGELLQVIRQSGLWDDTTLIVSADHGGPFDLPAERSRHVPLLVKGRRQTGREIAQGRFSTTSLVAWLQQNSSR